MAKYKVRLNKDTCIGCGMCVSIAPHIFEMGKMKSNLVGLEDSDSGIQEKEIDDEEYKAAKEAEKSCPTSSISVIEEDKE